MNRTCLVLLALGACAAGAHARTPDPYRIVIPGPEGELSISVVDVSDLFEPGMTDTETKVFGFPGKRMGLTGAGEPRQLTLSGLDRDSKNSRAWGLSVGFQTGPVTFRVAHQNKNVIRVAPALSMGNRLDAKNSILAANVSLGIVKAYAAYSANRGWGSSPLWNPDNPYGAALATTPSTDSRDVLVGVAMPAGPTTFLASFIRKNDRDLANHDADQLAFGATYKVSRRTDYYSAYSLTRARTGPGYMSASYGPTKGSSALNFGMRHSF
jgi:predicted porin